MNKYDESINFLKENSKTWLITGVAGFIGSNLLETLLKLNQNVIGLDNFSTGHRSNLEKVKSLLGEERYKKFHLIEGDIRNLDVCVKSAKDVDFVLHQAALGSVPRSIEDPIETNSVNISGFVNMLVASQRCNVKKFVYAASSSTYGDHPGLPKIEEEIGKPLSPYAVTKVANELYADVFYKVYGIKSIGLRYFNIFGPRQDPNGAYAAVIPKWTSRIFNESVVKINGDGKTSRDFCYIDNAVQANILSALTDNEDAINQVFNVAYGERTSLDDLYEKIKKLALTHNSDLKIKPAEYLEFRPGDVKHSLANIDKAKKLLGYSPQFSLDHGLNISIPFYLSD